MANNCLVTKLKSAADNGSLAKVGEAKITVNFSSDSTLAKRTFNVSVDAQEAARIVGNGYFTNSNGDNLGQSLALQAGLNTFYVSTGSFYLFVGGKYTFGRFLVDTATTDVEAVLADANDFSYTPKNVNISNIALVGTMKFNAIPSTFAPISNYSEIRGSVDNFASMEPASITGMAGKGMTGNIANLLKINSVQYQLGLEDVTGTVESFVVARAARNIAGTFNNCYFDKCTLNGVVLGNVATKFEFSAGGDCTISQGSTTVATYISGNWSYPNS